MAQMAYLTNDEIPIYCDLLPVTESMVLYASAMIDAWVGTYKGESKFQIHHTTETNLYLKKKGLVKLKYSPIVSIDNVTGIIPSPFNNQTTVPISLSDVWVEDPDNGYIRYMGYDYQPPYGYLTSTYNIWNVRIVALNVEYTFGYTEIPERVKRACGMIAMNISQFGTFSNMNSSSTLDAKWTLAEPSIFTKDIKQLLSPYRGV